VFFFAIGAQVPHRFFPFALMMVCGGMLWALVSYATFRRAHAAFASNNWVLRVVPQGVLLQFRSLVRRDIADEAPSVVLIDRAELHSIAKRVETRYLAASAENDRRWVIESFLDLRLSHNNTVELAGAMYREQAAGGFDIPMWMPRPDLIRVHFQKPHIRPKLDTALRILGRYYPVDPPKYKEFKDSKNMSAREAKAYANLMCSRGEHSEAFWVLTKRGGFKGKAATDYIDGRRRKLAGLCAECGYDLRATPNRCPECGHVMGSASRENK
jgi:hypothetical protein